MFPFLFSGLIEQIVTKLTEDLNNETELNYQVFTAEMNLTPNEDSGELGPIRLVLAICSTHFQILSGRFLFSYP